jgi:DNA modification methylase
MPFTYNPPTRTECGLCEKLHSEDRGEPVIDTYNGKASSANNFPFHNWYNFVLGYSPEFPRFMLERERTTPADLVVDPFMGSGTTLVCCKLLGIPSKGIDANDFMVDAARTKLHWDVDTRRLRMLQHEVVREVEYEYNRYRWVREEAQQLTLFSALEDEERLDYLTYVQEHRPTMLVQKYLSDKPFARASIINDVIQRVLGNDPMRPFFDLALDSIIVPISNVKYGPGFGVVKPRDDADVLSIFSSKLQKMIRDLESVDAEQKAVVSDVMLGDARLLSRHVEPNSAALIITSPPYPGDHEYTKHTRLELIFRGYARNIDEFRIIKRRMLRASTTNLYNDDNDREPIADLQSIKEVTNLIQERLEHDGATSGFEKLYTKLVWEYFGGMYRTFNEVMRVLRPGGKIALLVSDSHAFKMVHIQTAKILQEVGERAGFVNPEVVLWQLKISTSHKYNLRENVLILSKPL